MLEIERVGWLKPRYLVRDDDGHHGSWARRRFNEAVTGELDGEQRELRRDGRKRFLLMRSGRVLATADAGSGVWRISFGDSTYELRRKTAWRSEMELLRSGGTTIGSIRKGKALRGKVVCDLPSELSPAVQTLIGFLVLLTLWNRAAASTGADTVAVTASD